MLEPNNDKSRKNDKIAKFSRPIVSSNLTTFPKKNLAARKQLKFFEITLIKGH